MTFKKLIGQIHLWLGLMSGLVVVVLGITGCIYAFIDEIKEVVYKERLYVSQVGDAAIPLDSLLTVAQESAGQERPIGRIYVKNNDENTILFVGHKLQPDDEGIWYWDAVQYSYALYANPYDATIQKVEDSHLEFFDVVLQLHRSLLLKGEIGHPIVGISVIVFVILLITGLILWWPKNKNAAKQRFWFKWRKHTHWRRKNYDLHNILGYYVLIFSLIIALTGLVWSFGWFNQSVQWVANGGRSIHKEGKVIESPLTDYQRNQPLELIATYIKETHPNAGTFYLNLPQDSMDIIKSYVSYSSRSKDVGYKFDQYTGEILEEVTWADKNNGEKIRSLNYPIHVGSVLGFPGKMLAFFASLVSASLPVTGFYIWWGSINKSSNPYKERKRPVGNNVKMHQFKQQVKESVRQVNH